MSATPDSLNGIMKEVPMSVRELEKLPLYLMLIVVGGGMAVLLGIVIGVIEIAMAVALLRWVGEGPLHLIVCLVMGALLIFSFVICKRDLFTGSILAGISGIVLVIAGGIAGLIGGLFGVFGAFIAFLKYTEQHVPVPPPDQTQPVPIAQPTVQPTAQKQAVQPAASPPQSASSPPQAQKPTMAAPQPALEQPSSQPETRQEQKPGEKLAEKSPDTADSKFCMHCGAKVPLNAAFCNSCGGNLG